MHVPDGFLDAPTSIATAVAAAGVLTVAAKRSGRELETAGAPLAGLTAAFIFAGQMINFPVGAGTSGHLIGAGLAAALVGPWSAVLCMSVVLMVQGVFFADGGLTALGTNVLLMGVVGTLVGYGAARALVRLMPRQVALAGAVGAGLSVPCAALAFTALFAAGGAVAVPVGKLAAAMIGWHALIGIGEALITGAVLTSVLATRPDLVHLARACGRERAVGAGVAGARGVVAGLGIASLVVGGGLSLLASGHPDGLEFVAGRLGFIDTAGDSASAGSPLADYSLSGVDGALGAGLAGVIGVVLTIVVGVTVMALRRRASGGGQSESVAGPN